VGTVIEFDYADDKTPVAGGCPSCGGTFLLDEKLAAPDSYASAWRPPVICRGTAAWHWCKRTGDVVFPGTKRVVYFPDRRRSPRG
jgi:hypothetical protein